MGRQPKVLVPIAVAVLAVAGLALWRLGPLVAVGVLVVGGLLAAVVVQRLAGRDTSSTLDTLREATTAGAAVPLEPWSPPEPLQPWSPPEPEDRTDLGWEGDGGWDGGSTWDGGDLALETNPLDELDRLGDVDVVAEVERLEATTFDEDIWETDLDAAAQRSDAAGTATAAFGVHRVNEDVHSADDIMAASHATELSLDGGSGGENSELAKLLAKVQARLAAYE